MFHLKLNLFLITAFFCWMWLIIADIGVQVNSKHVRGLCLVAAGLAPLQGVVNAILLSAGNFCKKVLKYF
jgi:cytochrome c oxidase assembly factor CtaG